MKKKIILLITTLFVVISFSGCKTDKEIAKNLQYDIQGWWLNDSGLLHGFIDNEFILYSDYVSGTGIYKFEGNTLTLTYKEPDDIEDKVYSVKIEDNTLYLTTPENNTTEWQSITENEVRELYGL